MAADLEFRRDLPAIIRRRPATKLQIPRLPAIDIVESGEEPCRTPTSAENKIPEVYQCPAAPRKRKRIPPCKRRLMELEFCEISNKEEIEEYFISKFEEIVDGVRSAKRSFQECKL